MNQQEFQSLVNTASFEGEPLQESFEETHISWIAFTKRYAIKFKKTIKLSFLDFSTLDLRKQYCDLELKLNQRFSSIYLRVLPVREDGGKWFLGGTKGVLRDHAVLMHKLDASRRMDKMLHANHVEARAIQALAEEVAAFHENAEVIRKPFDYQVAQNLFNDIAGISDFVKKGLGESYEDLIYALIEWSNKFLFSHQKHIQERINKGYQRDLHGDLHTGNIFLYPQPVLFDCIEFDEAFRQIDLLYEIAFLIMELELEGHSRWAALFLECYQARLPILFGSEDDVLFSYYKCLRANIRTKVKAISLMNSQEGEVSAEDLKALGDYLSLMNRYMQDASAL